MTKFKFDKIVRNNIPGWHRDCGHTVDGKRLDKNDLFQALCDKLHEESEEVRLAKDDEIIEEVADVQQIIYDICKVKGISLDKLDFARKEKVSYKGNFSNGEYIYSVDIPSDKDKWAKYCKSNPAKYPEI